MLYSCRNGTTVFSSLMQLIIVAIYAVAILSCHSCLTGQSGFVAEQLSEWDKLHGSIACFIVVGMEQLFFLLCN